MTVFPSAFTRRKEKQKLSVQLFDSVPGARDGKDEEQVEHIRGVPHDKVQVFHRKDHGKARAEDRQILHQDPGDELGEHRKERRSRHPQKEDARTALRHLPVDRRVLDDQVDRKRGKVHIENLIPHSLFPRKDQPERVRTAVDGDRGGSLLHKDRLKRHEL